MSAVVYYVVPLALALVGLVSTGGQLVAHATNESSYQIGYNGAIGVFRCLAAPTVSNDCDGQGYTFNQYDVCSKSDFTPVDNMTACADGYADGFAHWCAANVADCAKQTRAGAIPHMTN